MNKTKHEQDEEGKKMKYDICGYTLTNASGLADIFKAIASILALIGSVFIFMREYLLGAVPDAWLIPATLVCAFVVFSCITFNKGIEFNDDEKAGNFWDMGKCTIDTQRASWHFVKAACLSVAAWLATIQAQGEIQLLAVGLVYSASVVLLRITHKSS